MWSCQASYHLDWSPVPLDVSAAGCDPGRQFFPRQFFGGAANSFSLGFFLLNKPESLQNEVTKEWDFAHKTPLLKFLFNSNNSNNDNCFLSTGIYSTVLKFPLPNKLAHYLQNQLHLSSQDTCRMQSDSSQSITLMAPASFLTVFLSPPPKPHEPDLHYTHVSAFLSFKLPFIMSIMLCLPHSRTFSAVSSKVFHIHPENQV